MRRPPRLWCLNALGLMMTYVKTLLCRSSKLQNLMLSVEDAEDSAGDVAFQTSTDVSVGFVLGASSFHVGTGLCIMGHLADGHYMQSTVQCSVAAAVETVSHGVA